MNSPSEFERLLLELIREIKEDNHEIKADMRDLKEDIRNLKDEMNKRFEQVDKRFEHIEGEQRWMRDKMLELWEHRKEVTVRFSRNWAWQNLFFPGEFRLSLFSSRC